MPLARASGRTAPTRRMIVGRPLGVEELGRGEVRAQRRRRRPGCSPPGPSPRASRCRRLATVSASPRTAPPSRGTCRPCSRPRSRPGVHLIELPRTRSDCLLVSVTVLMARLLSSDILACASNCTGRSMTSQVLSRQVSSAGQSRRSSRLLRAHAATTRRAERGARGGPRTDDQRLRGAAAPLARGRPAAEARRARREPLAHGVRRDAPARRARARRLRREGLVLDATHASRTPCSRTQGREKLDEASLSHVARDPRALRGAVRRRRARDARRPARPAARRAIGRRRATAALLAPLRLDA